MNRIERSCIIDDDPIFIYGTKRLMKEVDFCNEIMVYHNGQDAIEGLTELCHSGDQFPSVIFLDLNMPIMNGWEFLDDFSKIPNPNAEKVIIYIISSSVDPRDLERVKDYSMVDRYILKPISTQDFENILQEVA